ncbi:MAG: CpsD/CapB family tyrosine-protein kinase [Pararhodobacter sp.]
MVNTRILERRLGWRHGEDGETPEPPLRARAHAPMLQGRVEPRSRTPGRTQRRLAVEDAWDALPRIDETPETLVKMAGLVPAIGREAPAGAVMDQLRTQVMRVLKENGWRRIGVTSPSRGAGRSFMAAGLAASIARLDGVRVLLVDADLESPDLHRVLHVDPPGPLEDILSGQRSPDAQILRIGDRLAVVTNDTPVPYATEAMLSPDGILAFRAMIDLLEPDVVLHDMPPLLGNSLSEAMLPQLDAVLLISDGMRNTAQDIIECERILENQVPVLGVVLNKSEDRGPRPRARRRF